MREIHSNNWVLRAKEQLLARAQFLNNSCDLGDDVTPASQSTIDVALLVLDGLWADPRVTAAPKVHISEDGEICFLWKTDKAQLNIVISESDAEVYLRHFIGLKSAVGQKVVPIRCEDRKGRRKPKNHVCEALAAYEQFDAVA